MKRFFYLLFFDSELFVMIDREPLTSTIDLKMCGEILLEWRLDYRVKELRFEEVFLGFEDAEIYETPGDCSSADDNLASVWCDRQSLSSEYEFINFDIFENSIFFHEKDLVSFLEARV